MEDPPADSVLREVPENIPFTEVISNALLRGMITESLLITILYARVDWRRQGYRTGLLNRDDRILTQ